MARTRLTRRLANTAAIVGVLLLVAPPVLAAYPVVDAQAIAQLKEQLSAAKKQIETLTEQLETLNQISTTLQEQIDAIGKAGKVSLPTVTIGRLSNQVVRDAQCLMPDFDRLMPDIELDDIDLGSVCGARNAYANTLWFDPARASGMSWTDQEEARRQVVQRRTRVLRSAAVDALAHADVQTAAAADQADRAVRELETAAREATDANTRLAVTNQALLLIARQQAAQTQLLASLLKIQGAQATMSMVDQDPMSDEDAPELEDAR